MRIARRTHRPEHPTNFVGKIHRSSRARRKDLPMLTVYLLIALAIVGVLTVPPVLAASRAGRSAKSELLAAQKALETQDFTNAIGATERSAGYLRDARASTRRLSALHVLPFIGTQLQAADVILDVGINLASALREGTVVLQDILGPVQKGSGELSLATLTPADKRQILDKLSQSGPTLTAVQTDIVKAVSRFNAIPKRGIIPSLRTIVTQLQSQLPFLDQAVSQIIPASQIIPSVAGFPDAKTYLFLMENNTELRPTGGFIGTYGILSVSSGEITSFKTNDVYVLDGPMRNVLHLDPPQPLKRYNATTQWFFRDSNWSPDFPTSAQKALEFYKLERGPEKNLDGVIAVTPTFIKSLLKISGDITVSGITFTADNLIDKLQPQSERKELIGEMSKILINRILALPQRRWQELFTALSEGLTEKQMLLYANDAELEQRINDQNWGGAVQPLIDDGFTVIDANLAGLKTDSVMERSINYELDASSRQPTAKLDITYTNHGKITNLTTRYRTYTRVYVPKGSTLVSSEGSMRDDKIRGGGKGTVDVSEELDRTVFGTFISIEPGASGTLSFTYTLPESVSETIARGSYELLAQKQPGTSGHAFTATLRFSRNVKYTAGVDGASRIGHTDVALKTDLKTDRRLQVTF